MEALIALNARSSSVRCIAARSGVGVGLSLSKLRRVMRVNCHHSGQSIQCYHGLNGPSRPGTSFLINGKTKRITRIALAYGI